MSRALTYLLCHLDWKPHIHVNFQFFDFLYFNAPQFLSTSNTHLRPWTMLLTRTSEKSKPDSLSFQIYQELEPSNLTLYVNTCCLMSAPSLQPFLCQHPQILCHLSLYKSIKTPTKFIPTVFLL